MSGFILNRGKSFAARYKAFESKPDNKPPADVQLEDCSSGSVINCIKPVVRTTVSDDDQDDIKIDFGLSRTGSKSNVCVSKVKTTKGKKGKRNTKKEKPIAKSSKSNNLNVVPKYEAFTSDSDCDLIDDDKSDSEEIIFFDGNSGDSMPELDVTVINTEEPSPFKERKTESLTLKLKFNGKLNKFKVDYNERILKHINAFYKGLGVHKRSHELVITYNDEVLTLNDTASSLKLTIVSILEAYARERTEPVERTGKSKSHRDPNSIEIKIRNNQDGKHDQPLIIHLNKHETMNKLMEQYAESKGYNLSDLIFEFDGDHLCGEETPVDLEMENGSLIDVRIRNK